jgi:non-ribosomal peptide synthetase component F
MTGIPAEQQALRERCVHPTGAFVPFPREDVEGSIPARFARQVRRWPDRAAVEAPGRRLMYLELARAANRVAHAVLARRGPGLESVALLFDPGATPDRGGALPQRSGVAASASCETCSAYAAR